MAPPGEWDPEAERWVSWARTPGHDAYWYFRDHFFDEVLPPAGHQTVEIGCGSFTGTGSVLGIPETVSGTIGGSNISFNAAYADGSGYTWSSDGTTGSDNGGRQFTVNNKLTINSTSSYKNHGDYVSAVGGGAAAAHSCIGMPINSSN